MIKKNSIIRIQVPSLRRIETQNIESLLTSFGKLLGCQWVQSRRDNIIIAKQQAQTNSEIINCQLNKNHSLSNNHFNHSLDKITLLSLSTNKRNNIN
jgi:hypothetical protein